MAFWQAGIDLGQLLPCRADCHLGGCPSPLEFFLHEKLGSEAGQGEQVAIFVFTLWGQALCQEVQEGGFPGPVWDEVGALAARKAKPERQLHASRSCSGPSYSNLCPIVVLLFLFLFCCVLKRGGTVLKGAEGSPLNSKVPRKQLPWHAPVATPLSPRPAAGHEPSVVFCLATIPALLMD